MITFIKRSYHRWIWSWSGLRATWASEHSFRYWVWGNLVSGALAIWLPIGGAERALILALGVLVLVVELINTAIEHTVDYISTDHHPLAGKAKDAGSAAAMMSAFAVVVAWGAAVFGMLC